MQDPPELPEIYSTQVTFQSQNWIQSLQKLVLGQTSCLWEQFLLGNIHKGRPIFGMVGWSGKKGQNGTRQVGWLIKKGRPIF